MAVISELTYNGKKITKYNNSVISNINFNGIDYHFAKKIESDGICKQAVEEPITDLKVSGESVQSKLPAEYQQVEYIEGTGTQYIDTEYLDVAETKVELDFVYTDLYYNQSATYYMGANAGNLITITENGYMSIAGGNQAAVLATKGERYNVTLYRDENNLRTGVINGTSFTGTAAASSQRFLLFSLGGSTTASRICCKLYSCKIYYQDVLVKDFVPCCRKDDNEIGLYDLIENKFYTNAGSDIFLKGGSANGKPTTEDPIEIENIGIYDDVSEKYKVLIKVNNNLDYLTFKKGYYLNADNNEVKEGGLKYTNEYISVPQNTKYKVIFTKGVFNLSYYVTIPCYDKDKNFIKRISGLGAIDVIPKTFEFITPEGCSYIKLNIPNSDYSIELSTTTDIYLNEPLRKIGDYADYVDYKNKKIIRNIKSEFLTNVDGKSSNSGTYSVFLSIINEKPYMKNNIGYAISNKFIQNTGAYLDLLKNGGYIQSYITSGGLNRVAYSFNDTSITTTAQAKKAIGDGFEVCYILDTSIEEPIDIPEISTGKGTNTFVVETLINPSEFKVSYWQQIGVDESEPETSEEIIQNGSNILIVNTGANITQNGSNLLIGE